MLERVKKPVHRSSTTLSLDVDLVAEAKELGLDIEDLAEASLSKAISDEKSRRWKDENRAAIEKMNRYVEENGLPLEQFRQF